MLLTEGSGSGRQAVECAEKVVFDCDSGVAVRGMGDEARHHFDDILRYPIRRCFVLVCMHEGNDFRVALMAYG
ncbi:hypothetical protein ADK47_03715 [Streptomyces rimosus subsp. rimosus]|nr:hypothetical protein DF17_30975 [Streptomyces rimosus]KOG69890.1 hypothetical protein ADK78_31220 [Kitasatospora aureofaciens]KOT30303.1 hypothetical protein ADK42_30165 [Streptomyces rimosus subsp. rimosus]KOT30491.1 hypothetical protein ADK84_32060 [Streptomyces sp. NRRL WC-3701]KEF06827.1 hypothetical protein DF18_37490 [Streptomyces rimosus]